MTKSNIPNIGRRFLEDIDKFLAGNYKTLKCADIYNIYFQFLCDLKEFRGNSNGFTGLSEYLIFRFLYYLLGGSFSRRQVTPDLWEFVSKSHNSLRIGQSTRITVSGKRYYPDIAIYYLNELVEIIQIKVYLTRGIKEIDKEIGIMEEIRTYYPKFQALLIILSGSKGRKNFHKLEKEKNIKEWFNFLILKENEELLMKKLQQDLRLERIMAELPNVM